MASAERSKASSERQDWETTIRTLTTIMKTQHSQLGKLVKDRKILVDHVKKIKERWAEEVRLLEDEIAQVVTDFQFERARAEKLELYLGLKESEAFLTGIKLECTDSELEGFKGLFDLYCNKIFGSKEGGKDGDIRKASSSKPSENPKEDKQRHKVLEDEIKRLKQQYDKLTKEKDSEVSALLEEKKFVWNQYKIMENDYTNKLRSKNTELDQAEAKIPNLLASIEQWQSSSKEKDDEIANLRSKVTTVEAHSNKLKEEISRVSRELDLARKSTSASSTPTLNWCTSETRTISLRGNKGAENRINVTVRKDSSAAQLPEPLKDTKKGSKRNGDDVGIISLKRKKGDTGSIRLNRHGDNAENVSSKRKKDDMGGSRSSKRRKGDDSVIISSKRKGDDVITPKLFSSSFKVPKLKNASPHSPPATHSSRW